MNLPRVRFVSYVMLFLSIATLIWMRVRLDFNSAYLDESNYIFAGQELIDGKNWDIYSYMFSSSLPIYLLGYGAKFNGLLGARFVSACLGLLSLCFYFDAVRRVFNKNVAVFATLLLATSTSHAFISKFAVYDVLCVCNFIIGAWALTIANQQQNYQKHIWTLISSIFFTIALLSKYIVIMALIPIAICLLIYRRDLVIAAAIPALAILSFYLYQHLDDLKNLYQQQVVNAHKANTPTTELFHIAYEYTWPLLILFIVSLVNYYQQPHDRSDKTGIIYEWSLFLASTMTIYHVFSDDSISMYKHMVYSIIFLAPVCALYLNHLFQKPSLLAHSSLSIMLGVWLYQNSQQLLAMENAYPDSHQAMTVLSKYIQKNDTILAEDPYLIRNELKGIVNPYAVSEAAWYDNDGDGVYSSKDVVDGVWDGKFTFLYLDGRITPVTTEKLRKYIVQHHYQLIYHKDYTTSKVMFYKDTGSIEIYRRKPITSQ